MPFFNSYKCRLLGGSTELKCGVVNGSSAMIYRPTDKNESGGHCILYEMIGSY